MVRLPDAAGQPGNAEDVKNARELREIPVRVLRGFFSGVGQLLLAADRLRAEEAQPERLIPGDADGPPAGLDGEPAGPAGASQDSAAPGPAAGRHRRPADAKPASERKFRSLDSTGNVRVLTPEMPAESSSEGDQELPDSARLPVPGYDGLTLASLRARLRTLDLAQVRTLLEYERSAANRADVVAMFERRIAKLETSSSDAP
jgi:hypothetical protein